MAARSAGDDAPRAAADAGATQPEARAVSYPDAARKHLFDLEDESYWFRHRNRCLVEVIRRFHAGGTVWDVGGGNGVVAAALERAGVAVTLVEPGAEGVRFARLRGVSNAVEARFEDLEQPPGSLPAVALCDVLEHIADDGGFLALIRRRLVPGGRLFLTVPALPLLWSANDVYSGHFRRYTAGTLRQELHRAGFRVEYVTYFFRVLVVPVLLLRALPSRLGLRRLRPAVTQREHVPGSCLRGWLDRALDREAEAIRRSAVLGLGTSLLAVAQAPDPAGER